MRKLPLAFAGALALASITSAVYAEPSFSGKDRDELYRVLRQQNAELRGERYRPEARYYRPRTEYYGQYEERGRGYEDGYNGDRYPRYYRRGG